MLDLTRLRNTSQTVEFDYESPEGFQALKERLHGGFGVEHLKPVENYVERDLDIVIRFSPRGCAEKYEAFLCKVPSGNLEIGNSVASGKTLDGNLIGRIFQNLVVLADGEFSDGPQSVTVPTLVRLKRAYDGPNRFRQFVYFSLDTHQFVITVAPRSWERMVLDRGTIFERHFPDEIVETGPNVHSDLPSVNADFGGHFLSGDNNLYKDFSMFRIALFKHGGYLRVNEAVDLSIEISDIFFGPVYDDLCFVQDRS